MNTKILTVLSFLVSISIQANVVKNCEESFSFASEGKLKCKREVISFDEGSINTVRVRGKHINDWKIDHSFVKAMELGESASIKTLSAVDDYLRENSSFNSYNQARKAGLLKLKTGDVSINCNLKSELCEIVDTNFESEKGLRRNSFILGGSIERETLLQRNIRITVNNVFVARFLNNSGICDDFHSGSSPYGGGSFALCELRFTK